MTPGALRVLQELDQDDEIDLAQEGRRAYCGNRQTTPMVVNELLKLTAIKVLTKDGFKTSFTTYGINETGRALLRRPELEYELMAALMAVPSRPFRIMSDRIEFLADLPGA